MTEHFKTVENKFMMVYYSLERMRDMKFKLFIDKNKDEEVIVYAHEKSKLTDDIEQLVNESTTELYGYKDKETIRLTPSEVYCFMVENNKVFVLTENDKLQLKCRLYQLEEEFADSFVKINQSCMVNVSKIARFDASISGSLNVKLKNGYSDYISRRNLKSVKERLGL